MAGLLLAFLAVAQGTVKAPKPPEAKYDAARDVTTFSTGDVRTAGYSGYGARFEFRGKAPAVPASVDMGFGALRLSNGRGPDQDPSILHWNGVTSITISFAGKTQEFAAVHAFQVSKNQQVSMFLGRALEESMAISLTPAQFETLAAADSLDVHIGKDTQRIRGKSLGPLKQLAACIPHP